MILAKRLNISVFLDADDTLIPNALQRCVDSMDGCNADFVLFGCNVYSGIGGGNLLRTPNPGDFNYKAGDSFYDSNLF